jgi:hypothetical protein
MLAVPEKLVDPGTESPGRLAWEGSPVPCSPAPDLQNNVKMSSYELSNCVEPSVEDSGSEFFHPVSRVKRIPDPGSASKNLSILTLSGPGTSLLQDPQQESTFVFGSGSSNITNKHNEIKKNYCLKK